MASKLAAMTVGSGLAGLLLVVDDGVGQRRMIIHNLVWVHLLPQKNDFAAIHDCASNLGEGDIFAACVAQGYEQLMWLSG